MTYLYSGTPGSGKSLHAARDIRERLRRKRPFVICNFDVNHALKGYGKGFTYIPNSELDPEDLTSRAAAYWAGKEVREDAILLVLDEAQLVFNARSWNQRDRMAWIEFFSQHRHYGYKIVLVAQFDRMIDRQIRSLIEIEVNHRRMSSFGVAGFLLALPFAGKLFCGVSYYYGMRERLSSQWILPRRAYFRVYDSYNRFRQVPDGA